MGRIGQSLAHLLLSKVPWAAIDVDRRALGRCVSTHRELEVCLTRAAVALTKQLLLRATLANNWLPRSFGTWAWGAPKVSRLGLVVLVTTGCCAYGEGGQHI